MVWEASVTVIMGCGNCLRSIFSLVLKSKNLNKSNLLQYYPHLCGSLRRLGPWLEHQEASQVLWPHHHHPCNFPLGWRHLHGINHTQSCVNKLKVILQRGKNDEQETITLDNGTLSSMLLAHPKLILDKGKYLLIGKSMHFFIRFLDECLMADKIIQVEDFCTHSKILGRYQIRSSKKRPSIQNLESWVTLLWNLDSGLTI